MAKTKKKAKKTSKATARTYYPPKTFDDDLVALVDLYGANKWSFSNIDVAQLTQDGVDQRAERKAYDAAYAAFEAQHSQFGSDQEARYQRFAAALNTPRQAYRNDKKVQSQLARFKRSATRKAKAPATPAKPAGA